jgi:hypothetical protein
MFGMFGMEVMVGTDGTEVDPLAAGEVDRPHRRMWLNGAGTRNAISCTRMSPTSRGSVR